MPRRDVIARCDLGGRPNMWQAKELQISQFADPNYLQLPRFQRKSTWNHKKDFYLALSFFRGLPLGTVVLKTDPAAGPAGRPWLLDGRQRWEALQGLRNPDRIYEWAVAAMGIKAKWTQEDLAREFKRTVEDYFGAEPTELSLVPDGDQHGDPEEDAVEPDSERAVRESISAFATTDGDDVDLEDLLFRVLALVHPRSKAKTESGFTRHFAFHDLVDGLRYVEGSTGQKVVSAAELRDWIAYNARRGGVLTLPTRDEFYAWVAPGALDPVKAQVLKDRIALNWGSIERAISIVLELDIRLERSSIAAMFLTGTSASEDAKIFEIINAGGTPLTAAEVLSASPLWSRDAPSPHPRLVADAQSLYSAMDIEIDESVRRWDIAATLLSRLNMPGVLGNLSGEVRRDDVRRFERRITLGFQLMAGWYRQKISKDAIEKLPKDAPAIPWGTLDLDEVLNGAVDAAFRQPLFQYWRLWGLELIDLTSDAVALNFILAVALDWDRRGRPTHDGAELRAYRRNARVLLDRSILEYCSGMWKGSSDSRIASHLTRLKSEPSSDWLFALASAEDWQRLVDDVLDGKISDASYVERPDGRIRLLLAYRNVIERKFPTRTLEEDTFHLDHIIPESDFSAVDAELSRYKNHIGNLALLIGEANKEKSDKRLNELRNPAVMELVTQYEDVPQADFDRFSRVSAVRELVEFRGPIIRRGLLDLRPQELVHD